MIFDFTNGGFIFNTSGGTGVSDDGHIIHRLSDNMSLDLDSGDMIFTSSWEDDDDDDL